MFSDRMMPSENYDDLLPKLQNRGAPYAMTYLIRPDISWRQFELCSRSGILRLVPGIENFSTPVLRLMKKGVTGIQNIFTVFGTMYHRIACLYNFIWGFPGEDVDEYKAMAKLLPGLYHLIPPVSQMPVQLVRNSGLTEKPEQHGMKVSLKAHRRYNLLFSTSFLRKNNISLDDICHYYDDTTVRPINTSTKPTYDIIQHQIINWRERFSSKKARLSYEENNNGITVYDSRLHDDPAVYTFGEEGRFLCKTMFGKICHESELFAAVSGEGLGRQKVQTVLNKLCELRITIKEGNKYIWIAFPEEFYKSTAWIYEYDATVGIELRDPEEWEKTTAKN